MNGQDEGSGEAQASDSNVDSLEKNRFYALRSRGEQESSPDVLTSMLLVFSIDVYALLYPGAKFCFITPLISWNFDVFPNILNEPFMITTAVDELVVSNKVHRNFPIMLPTSSSFVELLEHDIVDFDVILGIDCFHDLLESIDC